MNIVHLSGTAAGTPIKVSQPGETTHVTFPLNVTHHTKAGVEKHESYSMNAWNGIGDRALDKIANGSNVVVQGYLSQSWNNGVPNTEVTITEFVASPRAMIRNVAFPATHTLHEKPVPPASPLASPPASSPASPLASSPVGFAGDTGAGIVEEAKPGGVLPVETADHTQIDDSEEQEKTNEIVSEEDSECDHEQPGISSAEQYA